MLGAKGRPALDRDISEWVRAALSLPGQMQGEPADRLIVASARHTGALLITEDRLILEYAVAGQVRALRAGA